MVKPLKQFVGNLSVFHHFVGFAFKELRLMKTRRNEKWKIPDIVLK